MSATLVASFGVEASVTTVSPFSPAPTEAVIFSPHEKALTRVVMLMVRAASSLLSTLKRSFSTAALRAA